MPPDTIVTDAARSFFDVGVVGSLCIILALVIWYQDKRHRAELKEEREAHQRTREAQIVEIRQFANLGESIRDQQKATESTIQTFLDFVKERERR
jgi:hypothetical protein